MILQISWLVSSIQSKRISLICYIMLSICTYYIFYSTELSNCWYPIIISIAPPIKFKYYDMWRLFCNDTEDHLRSSRVSITADKRSSATVSLSKQIIVTDNLAFESKEDQLISFSLPVTPFIDVSFWLLIYLFLTNI